jgi:hypothetical protein
MERSERREEDSEMRKTGVRGERQSERRVREERKRKGRDSGK